MSAGCGRAMKPGGWILRGSLQRLMDGLRLLAARFLCGLLTARPSCPPRVAGSNVCGGDPARPETRAANRMARGKRLRGAGAVPSRPWFHGRIRRAAKVRLRRNGKTIKAPGEARPPRALPALSAAMPEGASACAKHQTASGRPEGLRVTVRGRSLQAAAQQPGL